MSTFYRCDRCNQEMRLDNYHRKMMPVPAMNLGATSWKMPGEVEICEDCLSSYREWWSNPNPERTA